SVMADLLRSIVTERRLAHLRGDAGPRGPFRAGGAGHDIRDAFRQLRRHPGFAAAAIATLSLALGGVTAVFAIADPVLFRPLPYPRSDRLVQLGAASERGGGDLFGAEYAQLLEDHGAFAAIATAGLETLGILDQDAAAPQSVFLTGVSEEFFDVFGIEPVMGRRFTADEHRGARVAVITHAAWQTSYGGRPDILGQPLVFRGSRPVTFEIVGVMPVDFVLPRVLVAVDTASGGCVGLMPVSLDPRALTNPRMFKAPFARLRDGAGIDEADATVQRAMDVVARSNPAFGDERRLPNVVPLAAAIHAGARTPMFMLLSVTAFVMLLASANLAHLFMARIAGRGRELATRAALGASRARIVRLLLVEAALVAAAGAAGALLLGELFKDAALRLLPAGGGFDRLEGSAFDARVVVVVGAVAALALAGFGLLPALGAVRRDLRASMAAAAAPRSGVLARGALVLAQTATAVSVLVTALLLAASFARLATQDLGFDPRGIHTLRIASPANLGADSARKRHTNLEMRQRVEAVIGRPVALADAIPGFSIPMHVGSLDDDRSHYRTIAYPVSAEFFDVFRIRLTRGRLISPVESISGALVIVIDERAAMLTWPGGDPIGRRMRDSAGNVRTVIGVVRPLQTRFFSARFQNATAFVALPAEHTRPYTLVWRGPVTPAAGRAIRDEMRQVDAQATALISPFTVFDRQLEAPRFLAALLGALGLLAIALTVVGLYGVVSHGVAQRTREMGIRIALGAEAARIARLVVMQALRPAVLGVALGLAASLWWTETLRAMLSGSSPHDWRVFACAGLLVFGLVALACVMPIRRATRVDPLIALKAE
ncbi:MAG TPA: FtsX-like permease family protein, partial [Vicinamibacterales bacterium]|nr:FtsX-like permease family protein [Vicinamibacterales bacterium]